MQEWILRCAGSEGQITDLSLSVRIIQTIITRGCPSLQPSVTPRCGKAKEEGEKTEERGENVSRKFTLRCDQNLKGEPSFGPDVEPEISIKMRKVSD